MSVIPPSNDLAALVAARKAAIEIDGSWADYTDRQLEKAWASLDAVQKDLLKFDFSAANTRIVALELLLDGNDQSNFADEFKNCLFEALRKSAV